MKGTFTLHVAVLDAAQQRLWPELRGIRDLGFTLYGGTAIALRLGHRGSVDFDFFTEAPRDRAAIKAAVPLVIRSTTLHDEAQSWVVLTPGGDPESPGVKVSFFGAIGFGRRRSALRSVRAAGARRTSTPDEPDSPHALHPLDRARPLAA